MGSLILLLAIVVVAVSWIRMTLNSRRKWLAQLNLPGVWELQGAGRAVILELRGDLASGQYTISGGSESERGVWRLSGQALVLTPEGGSEAVYDLRMFDVGKIGIDGPGHERQIYVKRPDNVVPLRVGS
ncbi:MAG: hypothetical protein O7H39_01910 [Gammaproteobacteria bacterium]|nr:hypothetical protein [Gammaproteobacteria bacterium]